MASTPSGPAGRRLEIRQVWAHNLHHELALIRSLAKLSPFVSINTKFPGEIQNPLPDKPYSTRTASDHYTVLKANVDALHLIQVVLSFANYPNSEPDFIFQINLREFDRRTHPHDPVFVDLLRDYHGIDFVANCINGVDARLLAESLLSSGIVYGDKAVKWTRFTSPYDVGYLIKLLHGPQLPETLPDFLGLVLYFLGDNIKNMMCSCPGLRGELSAGAEKLAVAANQGMPRQRAVATVAAPANRLINNPYVPFGLDEMRKPEIRRVWAHNVEFELSIMQAVAQYFPYVSLDTEFPGEVLNPFNKIYYDRTPLESYTVIKANVDALHLIQVGLAFADSSKAAPAFIFEINLREFNPSLHLHNTDSIKLLGNQGFDFEVNHRHGVEARVFAKGLLSSGLVSAKRIVTWVTFSSGYDLGYLVKLLENRDLPETLPEFLGLVRYYFGLELYDVKHMVSDIRQLRGRLEDLAKMMGVAREAGMSHQAGSDSALTWNTFRRVLSLPNLDVKKVPGVVDMLGPLPHTP